MTIYGKCGACNRTKFFIRKRVYKIPTLGNITSQNEICHACHSYIKKINNTILNDGGSN